MGKVRRGGYVFEWWIGDHPPRHIHVSDSNGKLLYSQQGGEFEKARSLAPEDVLAFLNKWKPATP